MSLVTLTVLQVEYSTGVAAGVAAALMVEHHATTRDISVHMISSLQDAIKKQAPIDWTFQ